MNGMMNKNVIVKKNEFDKPLLQKIDSLFINCIKDCHKNYFHKFDHICVYDINFTNIGKNEIINLTYSDINMSLYELIKKIKNGRENGFIFNQIQKLAIKIDSNLSNINIHYYLKLRIPIMHRQFFKILSQNPEYVKTHCNDGNNPFHFPCRKWYCYKNSEC